MDGLISVHKPFSSTPFEVVLKVREKLALFDQNKVAYAGRLDPMASGVLLLMIGKYCKERDHLQSLNKTYRFSVLFGVKTDSLDPLGLIDKMELDKKVSSIKQNDLKGFEGKISQRLPLYSSYHIKGKPLFLLAKEGKVTDKDRPEKNVKIDKLTLLGSEKVKLNSVADLFIKRIKQVNGDFRQEEIIKQWSELLNNEMLVNISNFEAEVRSGTYIRSLAEQIAEKYDTCGIAYDIIRTEVGEFNINNALKVADEED